MGFLFALTTSPPMVMGQTGGAPAGPFQLVDQFGGLKRPTRIAIAPDGRIFVSDPVRGIVAIFDATGQRVGTLTGLEEPLGVAVSQLRSNPCASRCGRCPVVVDMAYVGDQRDGSVWVYENGKRARPLGVGAGEFLKPNAIAVAGGQVVYVVDSEAQHIKVFGRDGKLKNTFSMSYEWYPTDIALNEATGELFVSDHLYGEIVVFDLNGVHLRWLLAPNNDQGDPAFYRMAGLGVGPSGDLYVVDSALSSVTIMSPNGSLIDIIGYQSGAYWTGELKVPVDAASDGSRVYVTSSQERLVKVFGVTQ